MKSLFKTRLGCLLLLIALIAPCGCKEKKAGSEIQSQSNDTLPPSDYKGKELRKVTFLPYWVATAQFAGYYVGIEKGIYRKYGIDLSIIPFKPVVTSTTPISTGEADFAAMWLANAIELKANGTDIVNIAQPSFRSSTMLITKRASNIESLKDMNLRRAGIWAGYEMLPRALFAKYKLDVNIIPIGNTNSLFLIGGVDIIIANWFDEYHAIINSGYDSEELNTFFFADYGFNFLEDGIYCLSEKLQKDPQLCRDFVLATLEGWRYAFTHPEEAIDIVVKYAKNEKVAVNKIHQKWMLDRYRDLYLPEGATDFNNTLSTKDYTLVAGILKDNGTIKEIPDFNRFYQPIIKER
ncbi:MAG: ABC transporter substrate-binding protein [Bacteroidales bacterium]|nr:ABC transporter substrate-binding protein [Bacteroidales bacterium]